VALDLPPDTKSGLFKICSKNSDFFHPLTEIIVLKWGLCFFTRNSINIDNKPIAKIGYPLFGDLCHKPVETGF